MHIQQDAHLTMEGKICSMYFEKILIELSFGHAWITFISTLNCGFCELFVWFATSKVKFPTYCVNLFVKKYKVYVPVPN